MDKIINILLLTIIFVFDPLAIALVIAANFAFEKLKPKVKSPLEVMTENDQEMDLWDDTLPDGLDLIPADEWEVEDEDPPNEELKAAAKRYKTSQMEFDFNQKPKTNGKPVMVDPETGKFFYEEDPEPNEFDIDGDGKLSEEEKFLKEQIEKIRSNKTVGDFRIRRAVEKLKREFRKKHNLENEDDLTIKY